MSDKKKYKKLKKKLNKINDQLDTIAENVAFNQVLLGDQTNPPPVSCPSGFTCVSVGIAQYISLEVGINRAATEVSVGLKIAGISFGTGILSISNPRIVLGGEIYIAKAELVLEFRIEGGTPALYVSGEACIGPDILGLRTCTTLSRRRIFP